ncbi:MAG: hypothetical protein ISS84_00175 [Candidatus Pacebacteria bacterium]|nr:hypothetical protein [Candidatus Paceibacterota bacterium]
MKKSTIGVIVGILVCVSCLAVIGIGIVIFTHREATIVGKAYLDTNGNFALDYGDVPANGLRVQLQKVERVEEGPALSTIIADEVIVDENGEYRFKVSQEEEYWIDVVYYVGVYVLPYNAATFFFGDNTVNVQKGEVIIGPTILLGKGGMG